VLDDRVAATRLEVHNEADAAGVEFTPRIEQASRRLFVGVAAAQGGLRHVDLSCALPGSCGLKSVSIRENLGPISLGPGEERVSAAFGAFALGSRQRSAPTPAWSRSGPVIGCDWPKRVHDASISSP